LTIVPAVEGLIATAIVLFIILAWIAIGSALIPSPREDDVVTAPATILIGSGITSFALALFAAAGMVRSGTILTGVSCAAILVIRRKAVKRITAVALAPLRAIATSRLVFASMSVAAVVLWLSAAAQPRSADAMRYHLAHIRQIVSEGRWVPIADYHYALPFGWSLSFLPFEILGLPQGAQLLGLALLAILFAGISRFLAVAGSSRAAILVAIVFLFHPAVLRVFSEASADGYAILAVFTITLLLARRSRIDTPGAALLGFVSWIGMQSRYQLAAAGVAATVVFVVSVRGAPNVRRILMAWLGGSLAGLLLASPFYIANATRFGNPFWPLLIAHPSARTRYADIVAYDYSHALSGTRSLSGVLPALLRLFTTYTLFPLALVIVASIVAAIFSRDRAVRSLGQFGSVFFLLWFAMQPALYPRFVLLMLPVALLALGVIVSGFLARDPRRKRFARVSAVAALTMLTLADVVVARDSARYMITGDVSAYHRYTWFYPVYDWVNRQTPKDARVLVIVSSGHTYYLDRPYRRADPWLSAVVNWPATSTAATLDSVLQSGGYSYLIYEDRDWSPFPGGSELRRAIAESLVRGSLVPVRAFDEILYTSRLLRSFRSTRVEVMAVRRR
jgi:hypothetical protein